MIAFLKNSHSYLSGLYQSQQIHIQHWYFSHLEKLSSWYENLSSFLKSSFIYTFASTVQGLLFNLKLCWGSVLILDLDCGLPEVPGFLAER